ncbi:hypothetical protein NDU88_004979 [Pleurodeles waltl]|uniref:Uncharacterized protein n=1 Tax=Pleurodeles waltl TaxID=8319 RepID=A0AAV7UIJ0_PLEWA|nr:hypothetical protein NDU88_004979 [Pleurodeles waltl]
MALYKYLENTEFPVSQTQPVGGGDVVDFAAAWGCERCRATARGGWTGRGFTAPGWGLALPGREGRGRRTCEHKTSAPEGRSGCVAPASGWRCRYPGGTEWREGTVELCGWFVTLGGTGASRKRGVTHPSPGGISEERDDLRAGARSGDIEDRGAATGPDSAGDCGGPFRRTPLRVIDGLG